MFVGLHGMPGYSMTADQEKFAKMVFQALGEWWMSLGAAAWLLPGVLLMGGIIRNPLCAHHFVIL